MENGNGKMQKKIKRIFQSRLCWTCLIFLALLGLGSLFRRGTGAIYYDSEWYMTTADPVFEDGFHILNFPETFRGYFFPTILGILKHICLAIGVEGIWGWKILAALMLSVLLVITFPFIYGNYSKEHKWYIDISVGKIAGMVLSAVTLIYFMGDYLNYPLSDIPACFFIFTAIAMIIEVDHSSGIDWRSTIKSVIAGALLYAAYNTRAAFLYGIILLALLCVAYNTWKRYWKKFIYLGCVLIGVFLLALPQMLINHKYVGSYSPRVYTEQLSNYQHDLQSQQVLWGLTAPRYETYVGDESEYPKASVKFKDLTGKEIIQRENITADTFSLSTIIKLFFKYPLDMLGIYGRHLLNALTPIFPQIYITNMYGDKGLYISTAILLWLICATGVILKGKIRRDRIKTCLYLMAAVIPAFLQMAGAVEWRFFMPVHLILYYYTFQELHFRDFIATFKRHWCVIIGIYIMVFSLWISNVSSILSDNEKKVLLIDDNRDHLSPEPQEQAQE